MRREGIWDPQRPADGVLVRALSDAGRGRPFIVTDPDDTATQGLLCGAGAPSPFDFAHLAGHAQTAAMIAGPDLPEVSGRSARTAKGGVLGYAAMTEAAVDIVQLAGLEPRIAFRRLMSPSGAAMTAADMKAFADRHALEIVPIPLVIAYRLDSQGLMDRLSSEPMHNRWGSGWTRTRYRNRATKAEYEMLLLGTVHAERPILTVFGIAGGTGALQHGSRADSSFEACVCAIAHEGCGAVIIQPSPDGEEAPDIAARLRMQSSSHCNPMVFRDLGPGLEMLRSAGIQRLKILADGRPHIAGVDSYGLTIEQIRPAAGADNMWRYMFA